MTECLAADCDAGALALGRVSERVQRDLLEGRGQRLPEQLPQGRWDSLKYHGHAGRGPANDQGCLALHARMEGSVVNHAAVAPHPL